MKISAQEEYGLRCLLRLAQAEHHALTLPEVAAAEGLSVPYVAKLMAVLRDAGLIDSARGRSGGYRLVKAPEEIGLGSLLLVLGEPLFDDPTYCDRHAGATSDGICVHSGGCSLKALWQTLEQWMRGTLNQITLADLLQSEGRITELLRSRLASFVFEEQHNLITLGIAK
ncbi:MAG: Rrf2 family transcriptional regulator [Acidobacteriales bacterium]|nr:Rrf2 family transcriptional regulator [Terriglobales bacterium]